MRESRDELAPPSRRIAAGRRHDPGARRRSGHGPAARQDRLHDPDPARRVPDREPERVRERAGCDGLRGHLARRAEPRRPAAQPDGGPDQHQARRDHHERGRFRRDRPGHREGARSRHQGAQFRPADPQHAVRPHLGRRHGRDRPDRRGRDDPAADREERQRQGQGAADPGRSRRQLHARYPEGLRAGDGREGARRGDHQQGGDAVDRRQCRQGVRGPDSGEPRHRPGVRPRRPPDRADRRDHGSQGHEARADDADGLERRAGRRSTISARAGSRPRSSSRPSPRSTASPCSCR